MTHRYNVTGMTCSSCEQKVQGILEKVPGVTKAIVNNTTGKAEIEMAQHIPVAVFQRALKDHPKYQLSETDMIAHLPEPEDKKPFLAQYKPILVVFAYITAI